MDQESIRMGARADIHREGKMKIKLSQSDWQKIGIKMGWMKAAQDDSSDPRSEFRRREESMPHDIADDIFRIYSEKSHLGEEGASAEEVVRHVKGGYMEKAVQSIVPYVEDAVEALEKVTGIDSMHSDTDIVYIADDVARALKQMLNEESAGGRGKMDAQDAFFDIRDSRRENFQKDHW